MFDIGWSELFVIAVVAIIVVGPKDLPKLMRSIGHYAGKLRSVASDFQRQVEETMRESDIEEMRRAVESVKADTPSFNLKAPIEKPVMLPQPPSPQNEASGQETEAVEAPVTPQSTRKRGPAKPKGEKLRSEVKPKTARSQRGKKPAEFA
jgi:sec-independent protein translocase protein TatB